MALLGQSINPALFVQDYSGFAKAGAIQAQGMQNLGQQIQGIANDYATNKKEESKLSAAKKAGIADIQAAIQLSKSSGLGLESTLEPLLAAATDPNSSLMEQAAAAQQASQSIASNMNAKFKIEELNMQRQEASRAGAMDAAKFSEIARHNVAMEQKTTNKSTSFQLKPVTIDVNGQAYTAPVLFDPSTGDSYDPETKTKIGDVSKWMGREQGWEAQTPVSTGSFNANKLSEGLKPLIPAFEDAAKAYNVSPILLAAIAEHETGNGTSNALLNKKNAMGVSDNNGPISFGSPVESIYKMASLLGQGINEGTGPYAGVKSIQDIANIYAPVGAKNDPNGTNSSWASGVTANIQKLSEQPAQTAQASSIAAASETQMGPRGTKKAAPPSLKETPTEKVQAQRLLDLDKTQSTLRDSGLTARQEIQPLNELKTLLDNGVTTGTLANAKYVLKKISGLDVSSTEEFMSRAGEFAMKNISLTKGAISDAEMAYFKNELSPNVSKTNEGNKKVIEFKLKYAERAAKISDEISKMQAAGASPFEVDSQVKKIIDSNPLIQINNGRTTSAPLSATDRLRALQTK